MLKSESFKQIVTALFLISNTYNYLLILPHYKSLDTILFIVNVELFNINADANEAENKFFILWAVDFYNSSFEEKKQWAVHNMKYQLFHSSI